MCEWSERVFRTLHDRLPKELALTGITDMTAANAFLRDQFVPAYDQRFAVPAVEPDTAFVFWVGASLADLLCMQEDRVVANDNTVRYQGRSVQIPPDAHRFHYLEATRIRMGRWRCSMAYDAWRGISWMGE